MSHFKIDLNISIIYKTVEIKSPIRGTKTTLIKGVNKNKQQAQDLPLGEAIQIWNKYAHNLIDLSHFLDKENIKQKKKKKKPMGLSSGWRPTLTKGKIKIREKRGKRRVSVDCLKKNGSQLVLKVILLLLLLIYI